MSTGYSYYFIDHAMSTTYKVAHTFNDSTTTASNVGASQIFLGPTGSYEYLVRWNFEI